MENQVTGTDEGYLAALRETCALIDLDPTADSRGGDVLTMLGTVLQG